jgi:hypothetical protein
MDSRLKKPLVALGIVVALVVGVVLGISAGLADKIFGPNAKTIATSSLQAMRAENRLIAFEARYVSVVTTDKSSFGLSAERTLILPGDVRYELDLAALSPKDLSWDSDSKTLSVKLPEIEIAGPDVDIAHAREYGSSGLLGVFTDAGTQLDKANRAKAVADLRQQAQAPVPMRLAREAARQDIERSFALPLAAAGFRDVKVVARFPEDGDTGPTTYMDGSTPLNEVMNGANR